MVLNKLEPYNLTSNSQSALFWDEEEATEVDIYYQENNITNKKMLNTLKRKHWKYTVKEIIRLVNTALPIAENSLMSACWTVIVKLYKLYLYLSTHSTCEQWNDDAHSVFCSSNFLTFENFVANNERKLKQLQEVYCRNQE